MVEVIQSIKEYNTGIEQAHAQMVKDEINKMQLKVFEKVDKLERSIVLLQRDLLSTKMDQQTPIALQKQPEFDSSELKADLSRIEAFCHNLALSIKNIENRKVLDEK